MKKSIFIVLMIAMSFGTLHKAFAWGGNAHTTVTVVAERHLTPEAKAKVEHYLNHTLPFYAIWMDQIRYTDPYRPTGKWHSNWWDANGKLDVNNKYCAASHVERLRREMKNYKNLPDSIVRLNLMYLIHLVADMHCPSHNYWDKKAFPQYRYNLTNKKGKKQSYHSYWDNALNYGRRKWTAEQYADAVDKATPKEYKAIVKGTAYRWADTSLPNFLRTFELTPKDSNVDAYSKKTCLEIRDICDEEAMKGGYRLAHVLNTIFKK